MLEAEAVKQLLQVTELLSVRGKIQTQAICLYSAYKFYSPRQSLTPPSNKPALPSSLLFQLMASTQLLRKKPE